MTTSARQVMHHFLHALLLDAIRGDEAVIRELERVDNLLQGVYARLRDKDVKAIAVIGVEGEPLPISVPTPVAEPTAEDFEDRELDLETGVEQRDNEYPATPSTTSKPSSASGATPNPAKSPSPAKSTNPAPSSDPAESAHPTSSPAG